MGQGMVYLVGAGPGDPGLLTRRGEVCLRRAQVVVYDRLVSPQILKLAPVEAEMIYVGKASSQHTMRQEDINHLLAEKAGQGLTVVRLKGGDPYLFGRGGEEALYLREQGIRFEVVPGVTSALAAPAYAGIPVTHRDYTSTLAIVTGHEQPGKLESSIAWEHLTPAAGTIVFLMGVGNLPYIVDQMLKHGKPPQTPVALVRWGTLPRQQVLTGTLENIVERAAAQEFKPPALIVVGEVVSLRPLLDWFRERPLSGRRIVVTRNREQASQLVEQLQELGAEAIEFPTVEIKKEADLILLREALNRLAEYSWLVFTSANAVAVFFEEVRAAGGDARWLSRNRIVAIGPGTARALEEVGIRADLVPPEYRAEAVAEAMRPRVQQGERILLARARNAREILPAMLKDMGADVEEIPIYQAVAVEGVAAPLLEEIKAGRVDAITFTSSSTVHNFIRMVGEIPLDQINENCVIACIGPVTAQTAKQAGLTPTVVAARYTIEGLVESLVEVMEQRGDIV